LQKQIVLITPSHRKDFERLALLCDSIDKHVVGFAQHYIIVNDDDLRFFAPLNRAWRMVLPSSQFLPGWLRPVPKILLRNGRRIWWSMRSKPVHGWHVQQILKIAAVAQLPHERFCMIDSDNVFFRPFDVAQYAGGERAPLYVDQSAIAADTPLHADWTRNCDRLLGQEPTRFPADDFIGNGIVWDRDTLRDMTIAIENATGMSWQLALCRTRAFSEYLLYGHFACNSARHASRHELTRESIAEAYWGTAPLGRAEINAMLDNAPRSNAALCIESFSHTPVALIREAVAVPRLGNEAAAGRSRHAA
jgi:hypothetical protein